MSRVDITFEPREMRLAADIRRQPGSLRGLETRLTGLPDHTGWRDGRTVGLDDYRRARNCKNNGDRSRSHSGLSTTSPGAAGAASLDATARQPRVKNCHHHTYIRGKSCPLIVSSRRCHRRPSDGDSRTDGAERARDQ
ncbi:MAG: hypothetical protein AUI11_10620 [Acidobacteria bacterium 13_2_20CM_2_66_4]|nr:MAG: hypothetical protein AUI11_10620 [Acidobacteria bacterium 13_2_20CM_2_66_4]